jgi:hypothetical protein
MGRRSWYDADAADSVRVVSNPDRPFLGGSSRRRRPRVAPGLGECLAYPFIDGPGVAMLVFMPIVLFILTLPIFDVIAILEPLTRGEFALGLLALPILAPLMTVFALVLGYCLIVFGHMFVASSLGEPEHPGWPWWETREISTGLGRWLWAGIFGFVLGGFPCMVYWKYCGYIDWFDRVIFADLAVLGAGYALMALAASLLHDSVLAANPITVLSAILQVGWDFVQPCLAAGLALMLVCGASYGILFLIPKLGIAFVALWGFWVLAMYEAMVVLRMMGLTYYAHAKELEWFQGRPRWGTPVKFGKLYQNS